MNIYHQSKEIIKKVSVLLISIVYLSFNLPNNEETYTLMIKVKDLRNSIGVVQFAVYNKDGTIPDEKYKKYFLKDIAIINGNESTITFKDLPKGRYAINILHDENKNGKIDKNFILPKEGFGFSNYESIGFNNKPKFSKASFELKSDMEVNIKVIYM